MNNGSLLNVPISCISLSYDLRLGCTCVVAMSDLNVTIKQLVRSRDVSWYHPTMPSMAPESMELLEHYAGVSKNDMEKHIYSIVRYWQMDPSTNTKLSL